ncbi:MAG: DNA-protecting protein DprA [Xanthomonadales bacterium]|nr:DNA-processing protein DprA [Gammaproteobacteria bacterium]NNK04540.1 DNA-protecting protein DprA [Xanthomonadales bacterium]
MRTKRFDSLVQHKGAATKQRDWLVILNAPSVGGASLIRAIEALGSVAGVVSAGSRDLTRNGFSDAAAEAIAKPDEDKIDSDLRWLSEPNRHLLCWDDDAYPVLLRRIDTPPAALFIEGDPGCLWQPQIAVIGSRNPTSGGLEHAHDFSATLARQGMTITSGLASGIDTAAHIAALDAGALTIAVNGTGLDRVYPRSSQAVAERIHSQGAMISELPLGSPPLRRHFPSRNRIISGLSLAVLVIEAGLNSGTLITARKAAEQGRDVFALPGSLHNPMAKGCHRLIREGARLVETTADIMQELGPLAAELQMELRQRLEIADDDQVPTAEKNESLLEDPDYSRVWKVLGYEPKPVDTIIEQTGLSAREISSMLLMMELKGLVVKQRGGRYIRCNPARAET